MSKLQTSLFFLPFESSTIVALPVYHTVITTDSEHYIEVLRFHHLYICQFRQGIPILNLKCSRVTLKEVQDFMHHASGCARSPLHCLRWGVSLDGAWDCTSRSCSGTIWIFEEWDNGWKQVVSECERVQEAPSKYRRPRPGLRVHQHEDVPGFEFYEPYNFTTLLTKGSHGHSPTLILLRDTTTSWTANNQAAPTALIFLCSSLTPRDTISKMCSYFSIDQGMCSTARF